MHTWLLERIWSVIVVVKLLSDCRRNATSAEIWLTSALENAKSIVASIENNPAVPSVSTEAIAMGPKVVDVLVKLHENATGPESATGEHVYSSSPVPPK